MQKLKSFTRIWSVEKVIYAINDFNLPFPVTFSQIGWFLGALLLMIFLGDLPPLSLLDNFLIKYVAIPVSTAYIMNKRSFDGKKPLGFLKSVILYILRPKLTYGHQSVNCGHETCCPDITTVRSVVLDEQNKVSN